MQVRRRSGDMTKIVGKAPKNARSQRKDADTQVRPIANARSTPRPCGFSYIKNSAGAMQ